MKLAHILILAQKGELIYLMMSSVLNFKKV